MQIKSEEQLEKVLMTRLKKALSRTLDRCLSELQDIIERDVYNAYYGGWAEAGLRTYQFEESFVKRRLKTSKNTSKAYIPMLEYWKCLRIFSDPSVSLL